MSDPKTDQRAQPEGERDEKSLKSLEVRDDEMANVKGGVENPNTIQTPKGH